MRGLVGLLLGALLAFAPAAASADSVPAQHITLLFTNDVESAYDPIEAYWLDDMEQIGGVPQLATLINSIRAERPATFLFDSGDIFTDALAKLTQGQLAFELMNTMRYDAMAIGNHEFEYGEAVLSWEKNRANFPVLAANLLWKDTNHPFAQAHTIIERGGVRIGVIGIMGQDAATAIIPSFIDELDVIDPVIAVRRSVEELRDDVDLIVLLTHMGKTAPMQTDAESDPRLARGVEADMALAGAVEGIDVLLGGHADAGTEQALVHPVTGTLVMQTYGQGTHLGMLELWFDPSTGTIVEHNGRLIPVNSTVLTPDWKVEGTIEAYRARFPELFERVGRSEGVMFRRYIEESTIGNLFADVFVEASGADIGLVHGGSLRKDLPRGAIHRVDLLDAYPFVDPIIEMEMTGAQLREVLEQSLTLERGLLQVSGIELTYDLDRPERQRLVSLTYKGRPVVDDARLRVAVAGFLAEGGDLYSTFPQGRRIAEHGKVSDAIIAYFSKRDSVAVPSLGRQVPKN